MDGRRLSLLLLAACGPRDPGTDPAACVDGPHLWVVTADPTAGRFAAVTLPDGELTDAIAKADTDVVVRVRDEQAFALERTTGDALRVYEPGCYAAPSREIPLPERTNAHDVALAEDLWFVAGQGLDHLLVLDPETGADAGTVDLSMYAEEDGKPDPDQIVVGDGALYVALQQLDLTTSPVGAGEGLVVTVDPVALAAVASAPVGPNPKLFDHPADPARLVVLTGRYSLGEVPPDGALALLDPATGALDVVATEVAADAEDLAAGALGLDLSDYAEADGIGVIVGVDYAAGAATRILCRDWAAGTWRAGPELGSFVIDAAAADGIVWLAAREVVADAGQAGGPGGLLALDPHACALVGEPLEPALDPYSLASVGGAR